ncbi:MAG: GNAT family N-acetyltransferase [Candidatus Aenigmatarchaeota archaeon]
MIIRKFRKQDAVEVSNLIRACAVKVNSRDYPKKVVDYICSNNTPEKIIERSKDKKRAVFVAVKNGKVIGMAGLTDDYVGSMFVDPKSHGHNIGRELLLRVEKLAKRRGVKVLGTPSSLTAVGFYKKMGFKIIRRKTDKHFGKVVIMRKKL